MASKPSFSWLTINLNTWRTTYQTFLGLIAFVATVVIVSDSGEIQVQWALVGTAFATLTTYLDNLRRQNKAVKQAVREKELRALARKKKVSKK